MYRYPGEYAHKRKLLGQEDQLHQSESWQGGWDIEHSEHSQQEE